MKRQPKTKKSPEELAIESDKAKQATIAKIRQDILDLCKKGSLKIIPANFMLQPYDDTEYPKFIKVDNHGRIDGIVVYSKEEEKGHNVWIDPKKAKQSRKAKEVTNGNSEDGSTGNKFSV